MRLIKFSSRFIAIMVLLCGLGFSSTAQLYLNRSLTPQQLVDSILLGSGASAFNIQHSVGDPDQLGNFVNTNTLLPINYGLVMGTGHIDVMQGPNNTGSAVLPLGGYNGPGDPDLTLIAGATTFDACVLEFDFIPVGDTIMFNYVFGSDEYLEWVNSTYNDAFGFFLSGPGINGIYTNNAINIALLPDNVTPVAINNVHTTLNSQYYVDNGDGFTFPYNSDSIYIQMDGYTVNLTAKSAVMCDSTYHIKLAVADAGDPVWDSGVFLEGGSFGSNVVEVSVVTATGDSTIIEGCSDATFYVIRPDTLDSLIIIINVGGTASNDTDYTFINDSLIFLPGQDSVPINIFGNPDTLNEGNESVIITIYTITPCGDTIVTVATIWIVDSYTINVTTQNESITCPQDSIFIGASATGGLAPYHYWWDNNSTGDSIWVSGMVTDTFIVTVVDSCGFTNGVDTVIITVGSPPLDLLLSDTSVLCMGDTVNLFANVSGGTPQYFYDWSTGSTNSSIIVNPNNTTTYTVTVTDSCGTDTVIMQVVVTVPNYPPLEVQNPNVNLTCPGDSRWLTANVDGGVGSGYTYNWTWQNGSSNDSTINTGSVNDTSYYIIQVTDPCGEVASDTIWVYAPFFDPMEIVTDDILVCPGTPVNLTSQVSGGSGGYTYQWNGNGEILNSSTNNASATPDIEGNYIVKVVDDCGNEIESDIYVDFDDCEITIPNVFTPNGDGFNQFFHIVNLDKYPNSKIVIFNRWGRKVYESSDYQNDWNGGGHADGIYYWVLYLQNGKDHHGYVTVIR